MRIVEIPVIIREIHVGTVSMREDGRVSFFTQNQGPTDFSYLSFVDVIDLTESLQSRLMSNCTCWQTRNAMPEPAEPGND